MRTKLFLLCLGLALVPFVWLPVSSAQIEIIPGNSDRGAELFRNKNCIECHSFRGAGGKIAPDLDQPKGAHTPMQLAAAFWNHGPQMWRAQDTRREAQARQGAASRDEAQARQGAASRDEAQARQGAAAKEIRPVLESTDTADLFAYFYSMSYFSAPGNPANGAMLFEAKGCAACHEATASPAGQQRRKPLGPPISTWRAVNDPLIWAEWMWNHSGKIHSELSQTGTAWPQFTTQEMVDLLAYLHSVPESRSQSAAFQPGDPEQGRLTFEVKCETCHSFGTRTAEPKVDLLKRPGPDVLMGYVAAMWNHAPVMHSRAGTQFPVLGPGDMRNLVAYLFAQRYFYEEGNVKKGAAVFEKKNCALCHEQRRNQTGAPDLTMSTERYSPITMSAAIWRHGPAMFEKMRRENLGWPELNATEMADLITYLNSRLVPRVAKLSHQKSD